MNHLIKRLINKDDMSQVTSIPDCQSDNETIGRREVLNGDPRDTRSMDQSFSNFDVGVSLSSI